MYDCTYCGGQHTEETHGDALVVREHYRRDRAEVVATMLADAEALIETLPRGRARDAALSQLNQARALAETTSDEDYAGDLGTEIVRENIDAVDGALWAAGFVPVWDAGDYLVLASVNDEDRERVLLATIVEGIMDESLDTGDCLTRDRMAVAFDIADALRERMTA